MKRELTYNVFVENERIWGTFDIKPCDFDTYSYLLILDDKDPTFKFVAIIINV